MKQSDWHSRDSKINSGPARRTHLNQQGKLSVFVIILIVVAILAATAGLLVWQQQNRTEAASMVGQWYCTSDGMLYTFTEDGQFNARIGEIDILTGSWRASWRTGYLRFDYLKKNESHRQVTRYGFENGKKELTLDQLDGQLRQMNRQKVD
jgi:hypothetical protein